MNKILGFLFITLSLMLTACTEDPEVSSGSISGFVTESAGGVEPLQGVTVSILSTGQSTTTGSDGAFRFVSMQPGNYSLQFKKSDYTTTTRSVSVVAGSDYKCDVQLKKEVQQAEITIDPSSLNFGTTQVDMNVTIKNNGNATTEWALDLGNNSWLTASQLGGSIQAGKSQSITFTVNRDFLKETRTVIVNVNANGNSYPIHVSCAPRNAVSELSVTPTNLNFGDNLTEQSFTIRNTGTQTLTWSVRELTAPAISLSASHGSVSAGGSSVVKVTLDRSIATDDFTTTFIISDGIKDVPVTVSSSKAGTGGGNDNPANPSDIVLKLGLLAYFPFNGNYDDISGNDVYGYGSSDLKFVDGISVNTKALSFSKAKGSNFTVNDGLIDTKNMTVSFWAKDISEGTIFYATTSSSNKMMMMSYVDGHLRYIVSSGNINYTQYGNFTHKTIEDGQWHHIAITCSYGKTGYNEASTTLYIDGKIMDTISEKFSFPDDYYGAGTKFILGGEGTPSMQIAYFRVYDAKQLSADDIKTIYEAKQ